MMALAMGNGAHMMCCCPPCPSLHVPHRAAQAGKAQSLSSFGALQPQAGKSCGTSVGVRKVVVATTVAPVLQARFGGGGGGAGVLERPKLDQAGTDSAPRTSEGGEMDNTKQRVRFGGGERFRVLLLDHERHTETQVAKILPRVVPQVTPDEARRCFFESRENGLAIVTVAVKEHAEFYAQMMTRSGLRSSIEPDQSTV